MIIQTDTRGTFPLDSESVQCVVTSPPYWGLRDYGVAGQIGLEKTPAEYVETMVSVFREVWRVLKVDGVAWLNLGDSFAASGMGGNPANSPHQKQKTNNGSIAGMHTDNPRKAPAGLKPKDLVGIPWRVAFALQADGWYLRSDIVWAKPNPMPESVRDRCTRSHEYIFMLTKSSKYFYDAAAVKEHAKEVSILRKGRADLREKDGYAEAYSGNPPFMKRDKQRGHSRRHDGFNCRWDSMPKEEQQADGANKRDVWTIATQPQPEAHFATFPEEIPQTCILASSREGDVVLDPFSGSGTTVRVAQRLNRRGIGFELNPKYCDMAKRLNWQTERQMQICEATR